LQECFAHVQKVVTEKLLKNIMSWNANSWFKLTIPVFALQIETASVMVGFGCGSLQCMAKMGSKAYTDGAFIW
jgi:hypothetical protein